MKPKLMKVRRDNLEITYYITRNEDETDRITSIKQKFIKVPKYASKTGYKINWASVVTITSEKKVTYVGFYERLIPQYNAYSGKWVDFGETTGKAFKTEKSALKWLARELKLRTELPRHDKEKLEKNLIRETAFPLEFGLTFEHVNVRKV